MTVSPFSIQSVKLNGNYYSGVQGHAADYGSEMISPASDGTVHESLHSVGRYTPRASFSTLALKTMMDALNDSTDAPMKALNGTTGLVMVGAKEATSAPGYAGSTVHEALTALNGLVYATGISCAGGTSPAILSLAAPFYSTDGTAAVLVPSAVALPTQPTPAECFVWDSITHNSVALDGFSNFNLSIGVNVRQIHSGADIYPRLITAGPAAGPIRWRLTFDTTDLAWARTIGAAGSTSTLTASFTQLAQGGTRSGTTYGFTFNSRYMRVTQAAGGSQGSPMKASVEVLPRWDGTNKPVTWG
jgi:hypothetical protein